MTDAVSPPSGISAPSPVSRREERLGYLLVFLSAVMWSFGGAIARYIHEQDSWTVVFWRSVWAAIFLAGFMLWRDGLRGTLRLVRGMGLPGVAVAVCFATASASFVVALSYTKVANILLMQAGVPLLAALLSWTFFRERVSTGTWIAIAGVIAGVAIMVSETLGGTVSPIGDGLALLICITISAATVLTRRFASVRMTPATCLGAVFAAVFAATQASGFEVSGHDMGFLVAFGVVNLGLGFVFFTTGARLVPAAIAALLGTFEPILGPVWVWLFHDEVPSARTILGGVIVMAALLVHLSLEFRRQSKPGRPGTTGLPMPS